MPDASPFHNEPTAVDDVRRVREQLDRASAGDLRKHVADTNAAFERLQAKLGIKSGTPPIAGRPKAANG